MLRVRCPGLLDSRLPVCVLGVLCCVCRVPGHLAPVHRCARLVRCVACAVSLATWIQFTGELAWCIVLCLRCPGPPGSCLLVCSFGALCCVCGVLGLVAPDHRCCRSVRCVACALSLATWLLFTAVLARWVVLRVRCPGPLGSYSPLCSLGGLHCVQGGLRLLGCCSLVCSLTALCCVCGVLGLVAPACRCARLGRCVVCAVSWATWLLFTGVPARRVVLCVRCDAPLGACSPVCPLLCSVSLATWLLFTGVLRSVRRVACAVSQAIWLLLADVLIRCVVLRVRCPGPVSSCSPVCGVLGNLAPVHRCAHLVRCVACAVSWATWRLFAGVLARCVLFCVRCPGLLGSRSLPGLLDALCCVCGVLGHLAPVHQCARLMRCVASAVSWVTWFLFTGVPARCVVLRVRCPRPLGFCLPVCLLGAVCCVCRVLGLLAHVCRCPHLVRCVAFAVSRATWLLFTSVPAWCGVLGLLAPVCRCARSVRCVASAVS